MSSTLEQVSLKTDPLLVSHQDKMVSLVSGDKKKLVFVDMKKGKGILGESTFADKYGQVESYAWLGDNVVVGFSNGYVVILEETDGAAPEEATSVRLHAKKPLNDLCVNDVLHQVASGGPGEIRFMTAGDWREIRSQKISFPEAKVAQMHWSADGQLFTFATDDGNLYCHLGKLPSLGAAYQDYLKI